MRIAILVEGETETAFKPFLVDYLERKLTGRMPKLLFSCYDGRIPTEGKLKRRVENLLRPGRNHADAVIALTDVYTGTNPPVFPTAQDAKDKMRAWVGEEPRFHPTSPFTTSRRGCCPTGTGSRSCQAPTDDRRARTPSA